MQTDNKKRIIKNTFFLYIKLFISTIIGLYTSRLVLQILGVSDFGLYSIVGGIVVIMNFLGSVLTSTSYRFIAVELGKGNDNHNNINRIYNTILIVHYLIALLLLIIGNLIGTYYISNIMNIDADKIDDAIFVLHWTILSSVATVISIPSSGLIIAKEKFLYTSIVEIIRNIIKLILIIYLFYYAGNALRMYSIINFIFMSIVPASSIIYCKLKYKSETRFSFNKNWSDYRTIIGFAGWSTIGAGSTIALNQGNAIVLNYFLSTTINAAYGLANQINSYVMMFVKNIGQAAVPQIMKQYSAGNSSESIRIVYQIAKFSFFFILLPATPCLICMDAILKLWLGNVPQYTGTFATLVIISNFFWCLSVGFDSTIQASGKIKWYQIIFSIINIAILPINYILLKNGFQPFYVVANLILTNFLIWILQIVLLHRMAILNFIDYYCTTILPAIKVLFGISPLFIMGYLYNINDFIDICFATAICTTWIILIELFVGVNKHERKIFINLLSQRWKKN